MINKVTLIGRLGSDPEVKRLEGGSVVARFSLATSDSYKDKSGEWQETTEWHNIVMWRDAAERAEKILKKGLLVFVEGKIQYRKYTDKDNVERFVTDIIASGFRTLEKLEKKDGEQNTPTITTTKTQPADPFPISGGINPNDPNDLPF